MSFFNLFSGKKATKISINKIVEGMISRNWKASVYGSNSIIVNERYYNKGITQNKLHLTFQGGNVNFSDNYGYCISTVPMDKLYGELKDICNVL